jgi:16S rRNA (cytidine1402-2'-O)-methyltransferase
MALITDAGTPGISDPGFLLVRACVEQGVVVDTLPGATAFVPALVNSGLPCDKFYFEGFLPHKKGRQTRLKILAEMPVTIALYESPHRLEKSLNQMIEFFGEDRQVSVSREISKFFEETIRGTLTEVAARFKQNPAKGEIVMVVEGKSIKKTSSD